MSKIKPISKLTYVAVVMCMTASLTACVTNDSGRSYNTSTATVGIAGSSNAIFDVSKAQEAETGESEIVVEIIEPSEADETEVESVELIESASEPEVKFTKENAIVYTTNDVNIRTGPGTQYTRVDTLPEAQAITRVGIGDNGWSKVLYNNGEAYVCSKYLTSEEPQVEKPAETTTHGSCDNIVTKESGASKGVVDAANHYWNEKVPEWLKEKFVDAGWQLVISATPLCERFGYDTSIAGITCWRKNTIYLDDRSSAIDRAMIHELGHFIDDSNGWISLKGEFEKIYENEKSKSSYGAYDESSPIEYFASVFEDIIKNGSACESQIPESYEFVNQFVD